MFSSYVSKHVFYSYLSHHVIPHIYLITWFLRLISLRVFHISITPCVSLYISHHVIPHMYLCTCFPHINLTTCFPHICLIACFLIFISTRGFIKLYTHLMNTHACHEEIQVKHKGQTQVNIVELFLLLWNTNFLILIRLSEDSNPIPTRRRSLSHMQ